MNTFIIGSNNLYLNKSVNKYLYTNKLLDTNNLYHFTYDRENNITGASLNISKINATLTSYIKDFSLYLNKTKYINFLDKYYKSYNIRNNTYLTVPIGIIYENPFLFNLGPNVIISYDDILLIKLYYSFDYKNYGVNSIIVNIYLNIEIEQKIIKPILEKNNIFKYNFLVSSDILKGQFSGIVSEGFSMKSDGVTNS